jgi:hypothetical protein
MKWFIKSGKSVNLNPSRYKIDWKRKVSGPQLAVKNFLFKYWKHDLVLEEMVIPKTGGKRFDLVNLTTKTIIEVSPISVHLKYNEFMHGSEDGYLKKLKSDYDKMLVAELNKFKFIELHDNEINNLSKEMLKEKFGLDL